MKKLLLLLIGSVLCCTVVFRGCIGISDLGTPTVKEVISNPRQFTDREIVITGVVGKTFAIMNMGYFELFGDDASVLTVLSNRGMPMQGKRISVRGTLHQAYALGSDQMLVFVETPKPNPVGKETQHR
jgi:hypothetical protein